MVLWRTLVTGLVAWCGFHIVSMFGCASVGFTSPVELVCYPTDTGFAPGPIAAACLSVAAVAVLTLTWIPPYRRRQADSAPALALASNLHRLNGYESALNDPLDPPWTGIPSEQLTPASEDTSEEEPADPADPAEPDEPKLPSEDPSPVDDHTQLVDQLTEHAQALAEKITSGEARPQDVFWEWLALLNDLNTKHTEGEVPTEEFQALNTLLLDLMPQPKRPAKPNTQAPRQTPTSSPPVTPDMTEGPKPQPQFHVVPHPPAVNPERLKVPASWT